MHAAIGRMDELSAGLCESLATRTVTLQHQLALKLDDVRRVDLYAGQPTRTRALIRSNAGNPHVLAVPHNRSPAYDLTSATPTLSPPSADAFVSRV